jgi:hypothetical protein
MGEEEEARAIEQVVQRLAARFPQTPTETIAALVAEVHRELDGKPIRDFVPVLVERAARDRLTQLHHAI